MCKVDSDVILELINVGILYFLMNSVDSRHHGIASFYGCVCYVAVLIVMSNNVVWSGECIAI